MSAADQDTLTATLLDTTQRPSAFTGREAALVVYADLVTLRPSEVTKADIERLRDAGFDDRGIHDACAIIAYFAFVNRIADGLGVELEGPGS